MLEKVQHIGVLVKNMDISLEFYMNVLRLPLRERKMLPNGIKIAFLPIGDTEIELVASPEQSDKEGLDHLVFLVKDLNKALQILKKAGLFIPKDFKLNPNNFGTVLIPQPQGSP